MILMVVYLLHFDLLSDSILDYFQLETYTKYNRKMLVSNFTT